MAEYIENYLPPLQANYAVNGTAFQTNKPALFGSTVGVTGLLTAVNVTISGTLTATGARVSNIALAPITTYTAPSAINSTNTITAAQILSGYITSTSAAGTTLTMPTGTLLGQAIPGVARGTTLEFIVDNTAGASTITMAVGTNAVQSDWDNQITIATASVTPAAITPLTIASGVSGIATFKIVFASATAYVFSRVS